MRDDGPARFESTLVLAAVLTTVTGFVDAHVYLHVVRVWVANQSGNAVLIGIAVGEARWPEVVAHAVALSTFAFGVAVGTVVHARRRASGQVLRPDLVLLVEAAMLALLTGLVALDDTPPFRGADPFDDVVLAVGALAMGLQTVVIGRVGAVTVATTYESGALARVGEEAAQVARAARGRDADGRSRHLVALQVLGVVVASYVAGAALSAAVGSSAAWLLLPVAVVAVCSAPLRRHVGRSQAPPAA